MTKLTHLRSIEDGLRRALSTLGDDGAEEAIQQYLGVRRSASLLRKCANPDDERHQIQLRYALALDAACKRENHTAPLLDAYRHAVEWQTGEDRTARNDQEMNLTKEVLDLQIALGNLANAVKEACGPDSPSGSRLSNSERRLVFSAVETMESHCEALKDLLTA